MIRLALIATLFPACLPSFDDVEPPPIDPPPVAPPVDPVTRVAVTVRDGSIPVAGVPVVFQATDDRVLADVVTDASGVAEASLPDGGHVTVIRADGPRVTAYTIANVEPGDELEVTQRGAPVTTPLTATLRLPANGQFAVISPCGIATGGPQLPIQLSGCGAETDFFAIGTAGAFLAHRTVTPTIDLSTESMRSNLPTTLAATNVPANTSVALEKRLLAGGYSVFSTGELPGQAPVTVSVPDIAVAADQLVIARLGGPRRQDVATRAAYSMNAATIDVGAAMIPYIDPAIFDGTTVTWTQDGTGAADLAVVTLVDGNLTRIVAAPITAPTLALPSFARARGVDVTADALVEHSTIKVTGGYDAVRGRVFGVESLLEVAPAGDTIAVASAN